MPVTAAEHPPTQLLTMAPDWAGWHHHLKPGMLVRFTKDGSVLGIVAVDRANFQLRVAPA